MRANATRWPRHALPVSSSSSTRREHTSTRSGVGAGAGPSGGLLSNFNTYTLPATHVTFLDTKPPVVSSSSCCAHATCSTKCTYAICGDCTPCRHRLGASLLPPECPPRGVIRVCAGCQGGCARHTDSATFQVTVTPIRLHQHGVRVAFQPEDMLPDTRHLQTACTHTVCPAGACLPSASQAGLIRKLITPLKAHDI